MEKGKEAVKPRYYQSEAKQALYKELKETRNNTVIELPTGSGKSFVIADICKDMTGWGRRVLNLTHVKELIEQNHATITRVCPDVDVSIYSAGLKQKDHTGSVVVAGIQSIYKQAYKMDPYDLVIIDECHLCPADDEGMYREFISDLMMVNPKIRIVGLSATPYRLDSGYVYGSGRLFHSRCYSISVAELIANGFLSKVVSKGGLVKGQLGKLKKNHDGDYTVKSQEDVFNGDEIVESACKEIAHFIAEGRKRNIIYCASVEHARHVCKVMKEQQSLEFDLVTGESPSGWRSMVIDKFRNSPTGMLCNVGVYTTGLDVPSIDLIAILRVTDSVSLWQQMVGRGLRVSPGKTDCLVLDYGDNIIKHGPIDKPNINEKTGQGGDGVAPVKECPNCHTVISVGYTQCPECGHEFEREKAKHNPNASSASLLSQEPEIYEVVKVSYSVHVKRSNPLGPKTLRVDYEVTGTYEPISEWVCLEHTGMAMEKAFIWWKARSSEPMPRSASDAVEVGNMGRLKEPSHIYVIKEDRFKKIIKADLLPAKPISEASEDGIPPGLEFYFDVEEIPF